MSVTTSMASGKAIIVTGGSRGIGRAIVDSCARSGAYIGLNFLRAEAEARELLDRYPSNIELLRFDVGDYEAAKASILSFIKRRGRIDILVNNAGTTRPHILMAQANLSRAAEDLRVNTLGTMNCTRLVLPAMVKARDGFIINMSSCAVTRPEPGQASYAASKAAVEAFTRAIAVEYASRGIKAVCLRLGPVRTDLLLSAVGEHGVATVMPNHVLPGTVAEPADIAEVVQLLISAPTRLVTGSTLDFTAGYSLR